MDTSDRKVIFGCCGGVVLIAAVMAVGGWIFYRQAIEPNIPQMSPPDSLEAEGPSVGGDFMERSVFFEDERLGIVTDIAADVSSDPSAERLVIAGGYGAAVVGSDGDLMELVEFPRGEDVPYGMIAEVRDVDGDGDHEFLMTSNLLMVPGPAALLDSSGEILWRTDLELGPLAAGDVDGDGELEFAGVSDAGMTLLETDGTVQWQKGLENYPGWPAGMADTDENGRAEVIHPISEPKERRVEIVGRDANGDIVHRARRKGDWLTAGFFTQFSMCPWPSRDGQSHLLIPSNKHISLVALDGETVLRGTAPGTNIVDHVWGVPVRLRATGPSYLATVTISLKFDTSFLRIHDADGELLFERATNLTDDDAIWPGLAAWQPPGEKHEVLLVGGNGKVWRYEMMD